MAQILLKEYAIKWLFVIPPLLTNVSALPWESWTPKMGLFSHAQKCFDMLYLQHSSTNFDNILYTIRSYYYIQYANNYLLTSHFCVTPDPTRLMRVLRHLPLPGRLSTTCRRCWHYSLCRKTHLPNAQHCSLQLKQIFNQNLIFFSKRHV